MGAPRVLTLCEGHELLLLIRHPGGRCLRVQVTAEADRVPGTLRIDLPEPQHMDNRQDGALTMLWAMPDATDAMGGKLPLPVVPRSKDPKTAHLVAWLDVREAGRELAVLMEDVIEGCGNAPPHPADCDDCRPERDALDSWARANGRLSLLLERGQDDG